MWRSAHNVRRDRIPQPGRHGTGLDAALENNGQAMLLAALCKPTLAEGENQ